MEDFIEYIETWPNIEKKAGRHFSQFQRQKLREAGVIFDKLKGKPPNRRKVIYTYWTLYLNFMVQNNGKFAILLIFLLS
jgi:hypothetical protein